MNSKDIMPFHLFNHQGNYYVINIEKMQASPINEMLAKTLGRIGTEPDKFITSELEEDLQKLQLISEGTELPKKTTKKGLLPITTIALFLTQSCNLKCIYCYGNGGEYGTGGSMEEKTAFQAVDWLIEQSREKKKLNIVFFGGEPFLNFALMKTVVQYAQQRVNEAGKNVGFHVTTNATLIKDEVIFFLKEYKVNVMISIDGPKEIQDKQRPFAGGQGTYDAIAPKIRKLLKVLPETRGHAVIADATDPLLVKEALKEIGFKNITTAIMSASLLDGESEEGKPPRDMSRLLNLIELEAEAWLTHTKNRDTQSLKELIADGYLAEGIVSILHNNKKLYPCKASLEFAGISCAGDVYPCQRFIGLDKYKLGNVFTKELERDIYHQPPRTYVKKCGDCFAKYHCAGGCKYMNAVSSGSIFNQSEDLCRLKRRELELSAYIYCKLDHLDSAFLIEHKLFPPKPCPLDL